MMRWHLPLLGALLLAGCAMTGERSARDAARMERYVAHAGEPIDSFHAFRIDNWTALSRDRLVLWTGINQAYLLRVWKNCRNLQFNETIRVSSTASTVSRFDYVFFGQQRCPIAEIRSIDVRRMKADLAAGPAMKV